MWLNGGWVSILKAHPLLGNSGTKWMHNFGVQAEHLVHGTTYFLSFRVERLTHAPPLLAYKYSNSQNERDCFLKDN
jgi:hypothetical protein